MNTQPEIYRCYYTPCSILPLHTAAVALSSSVVCAHTWVHLVCTCMVWWVGGTTSKAGEPRTGVWRARLQKIWTLGNFDAAAIFPGQCRRLSCSRPCISNRNMMRVASKAFPRISNRNMMRVASKVFHVLAIRTWWWLHPKRSYDEGCIQSVPMHVLEI